MLWCVFDHSLTHVVVLNTVNGCGLKPPPAQREDQRVMGLEDSFCQAMLLYSKSYVTHSPFSRQHPAHQHRVAGVKVLHKLTRHTCTERKEQFLTIIVSVTTSSDGLNYTIFWRPFRYGMLKSQYWDGLPFLENDHGL